MFSSNTNIERLIYPQDKQNVPNATNFLLCFVDAITNDGASFSGIPYQLLSIEKHIVMSFYVYIEMSISEQLRAIATSSYLLFYLYKQNTTPLMPAQLYNDLQCTFNEALLCAAKLQISSPGKPLYLVRNGTDPLERYFGTGRMHNHSNVMDALGLIHISRSMVECNQILVEQHPNSSKKSRCQRRIALDYSNPRDWTSEHLILDNVQIKSVWMSGCMYAFAMILEKCEDFDLSEMKENGLTLRCPLKRNAYVGLNTSDIDWSIIETDADPL